MTMDKEELDRFGFEVFRFVKERYPKSLNWPKRSRYVMTYDFGDVYCVIYRAAFKSKYYNHYTHESLWVPKEHIEKWYNHIYVDSVCKLNVKNYGQHRF